MGVDQTVVMGVTLVVLLAMFVVAFEYVIPMILKFEFDTICRKYVLLSESQNGLSTEDYQQLKLEIEQLGLVDHHIEYGKIGEVKRGEVHVFTVEGIYKHMRLSSIFYRTDKEIKFIFKQDYPARKIVM
jgi:hypothetical protein